MNALITLSLLAILVLYLGLFKAKKALLPVTLLGLTLTIVLSINEWNGSTVPIFSGMMLFDNFAIAFTGITLLTTILILLLAEDYFGRFNDHTAEYYTIILFSLVGVVLMVSYHNLAILFIGIEIMSVSLYILAGIRKKSFASNEASLKYFLMGAFSTGFLLFGIALLYGATASFDLDGIKDYVTQNPQGISPLFYTGIILMIIGLSFKIGAAPFHFWVPDVYEGSPTLITSFMSTVVKTAGVAAFLRLFLVCFTPLQEFWMPVMIGISALTLFIGNVTAVFQQSFKRMLAYSSISHAGYMLFAIIVLGKNASNAVFIYAAAYSIATIVAFAILILVKYQTGSDKFDSFNGLGKRNPFLALSLTIAMLSLAGIPLTAGFIGKFFVFTIALSDYHVWLVIFAVLNAIVGIFYYLKVVISMYFKENELAAISTSIYLKLALGFSCMVILIIGIYPAFISNLL